MELENRPNFSAQFYQRWSKAKVIFKNWIALFSLFLNSFIFRKQRLEKSSPILKVVQGSLPRSVIIKIRDS